MTKKFKFNCLVIMLSILPFNCLANIDNEEDGIVKIYYEYGHLLAEGNPYDTQSKWYTKDGQLIPQCRNNDDCPNKMFCNIERFDFDTPVFAFCKTIKDKDYIEIKYNQKDLIYSNFDMHYETAENWCKANNAELVSPEDIGIINYFGKISYEDYIEKRDFIDNLIEKYKEKFQIEFKFTEENIKNCKAQQQKIFSEADIKKIEEYDLPFCQYWIAKNEKYIFNHEFWLNNKLTDYITKCYNHLIDDSPNFGANGRYIQKYRALCKKDIVSVQENNDNFLSNNSQKESKDSVIYEAIEYAFSHCLPINEMDEMRGKADTPETENQLLTFGSCYIAARDEYIKKGKNK